MAQYFGKYRAQVVDVDDPEKRGRIRVKCPKVLGEDKSNWCQPCTPYAIDTAGDFVLPKVDEFVWVEFEEGDVQKPLWVGCLWSKEKSPVDPGTYSDEAPKYRQFEFEDIKITFKKENGDKIHELYLIVQDTGHSIQITEKQMVLTLGAATMKMSDENITLNIGGSTIQMLPAVINITSPTINLN